MDKKDNILIIEKLDFGKTVFNKNHIDSVFNLSSLLSIDYTMYIILSTLYLFTYLSSLLRKVETCKTLLQRYFKRVVLQLS